MFCSQYQQRIPYELLSGLANCLLNETIFKIVEGLTEIQQVTEKQLLQGRLQLLQKHRAEKESLVGTEGREEILKRQADELKQADMNLILQVNFQSKQFCGYHFLYYDFIWYSWIN